MSMKINEMHWIGEHDTLMERKWYQEPSKVAGTIISLVSAIACTVLQGVYRKNPLISTFSSIGIGASTQAALEIALPTNRLNVLHHIEMKNAFALYFILTQIYLNLPEGSVEREAILYCITGLGGAWLSLKVAAIFTRKLGDKSQETPLFLQDSSKALLFEPNSKAALVSYQLCKTIASAGMIGVSRIGGYDYLDTLYNVGMFLAGHTAGVLTEEGLSHLKHYIRIKHQEDILDGTTPVSLRLLNIIERVIDTFGNHGWGMLMALNHPAAYASIGGLVGFTKMTAKSRFTTEYLVKEEINPTLYKVDRIVDVILALAVTGWVTAILVDDNYLFDRIGISSMGAGVGLGYGLRFLLNRKQALDKPIKHSLDFYTREHPVVWILPFSYIWEQLQINDIALTKMPIPSFIMAAIGWGSLGSSFGIDRALIDPKISPVVDSLYGNLFFMVAKGHQ